MEYRDGRLLGLDEGAWDAIKVAAGRKSIYNIDGIPEGNQKFFSLAEYRKRNGQEKTARQMENALRSAVSKCRKATARRFEVVRIEGPGVDGFGVKRMPLNR